MDGILPIMIMYTDVYHTYDCNTGGIGGDTFYVYKQINPCLIFVFIPISRYASVMSAKQVFYLFITTLIPSLGSLLLVRKLPTGTERLHCVTIDDKTRRQM